MLIASCPVLGTDGGIHCISTGRRLVEVLFGFSLSQDFTKEFPKFWDKKILQNSIFKFYMMLDCIICQLKKTFNNISGWRPCKIFTIQVLEAGVHYFHTSCVLCFTTMLQAQIGNGVYIYSRPPTSPMLLGFLVCLVWQPGLAIPPNQPLTAQLDQSMVIVCVDLRATTIGYQHTYNGHHSATPLQLFSAKLVSVGSTSSPCRGDLPPDLLALCSCLKSAKDNEYVLWFSRSNTLAKQSN